MGWDFYADSRIDKKAIIRKLKEPGSLAPGYEMLKSTVIGNNFWYLMRTPEGKITIGLTLMKSGGQGYGWGTKELSETMGPNELDCPLAYLDEASPPEFYAVEWRENVRKYHAEQDRRKTSRPAYAEGQLWTTRTGLTYQLLEKLEARRGWHVVKVSTGMIYRAPFRHLAAMEYTGEYQAEKAAA